MVAPHEDRNAEKQNKRNQSAESARVVRRNTGLQEALDTPGGRELVWWLLQIAGVGGQPYLRGGAEAERETTFRLGELNIGQQVLALVLEINPQAYPLMQQEQDIYDRASRTDPASGSPDASPGTFALPESDPLA